MSEQSIIDYLKKDRNILELVSKFGDAVKPELRKMFVAGKVNIIPHSDGYIYRKVV